MTTRPWTLLPLRGNLGQAFVIPYNFVHERVPKDLAYRFDSALLAADIAEHHQPHFRRWLRFYLDYCWKYQRDSSRRSSLSAFYEKLRDKGQADWQRQQAQQAN